MGSLLGVGRAALPAWPSPRIALLVPRPRYMIENREGQPCRRTDEATFDHDVDHDADREEQSKAALVENIATVTEVGQRADQPRAS